MIYQLKKGLTSRILNYNKIKIFNQFKNNKIKKSYVNNEFGSEEKPKASILWGIEL